MPQQDEGDSCGYRMLRYLNKVIKGQTIQHDRVKDRSRLCYYLEIAQTLKDNQIKRKQRRKGKVREKQGRKKKRRNSNSNNNKRNANRKKK